MLAPLLSQPDPTTPNLHPPTSTPNPTTAPQVPYATGRAERVVGEYDEFIRRMIDQIGRSKEQVRACVRALVYVH